MPLHGAQGPWAPLSLSPSLLLSVVVVLGGARVVLSPPSPSRFVRAGASSPFSLPLLLLIRPLASASLAFPDLYWELRAASSFTHPPSSLGI